MKKSKRIKRFNERFQQLDQLDRSKMIYEGPLMLFKRSPYYKMDVLIARFDTRDADAASLLRKHGFSLDDVKQFYGIFGSKGIGGGELSADPTDPNSAKLSPVWEWSDENGIIWAYGGADMINIPDRIREKIAEYKRGLKITPMTRRFDK